MLRTLLAVAVLATAVVARDFYWRHETCNTEFANPANWDGSSPYVTDEDAEQGVVPPETVFFGPRTEPEEWSPVSSYAKGGIYRATELVFADEGILTLHPTEFVMEFLPEDMTDGVVLFNAGQEFTQECDYHCHENWQVGNERDGFTTPSLPPWDRDTAIVRPETSVKIQARSFVNLFSFRFGSAEEIQTKQEIPTYQMYPGPQRLLMDFNNKERVCEQLDLYNEQFECVVYSSCSKNAHLQQARELRSMAELASAEDLSEIRRIEQRPFSAVFNYRNLARVLSTDEADSAFDCLFSDYNFDPLNPDDPIVHAIVKHLDEKLPGVAMTVDRLSYDPSRRRIIFEGVVSAPFIFFHRATGNGNFVNIWQSSRTFSNINARHVFYLFAWEAIAKAALECVPSTSLEREATMRSSCDGDFDNLCSDLEMLHGLSGDDTAMMNNVQTIMNRLNSAIPTQPSTTTVPTTAEQTTMQPSTEDTDSTTTGGVFRRRRDGDESSSSTESPTTEDRSTTRPDLVVSVGNFRLSESELELAEDFDLEMLQQLFDKIEEHVDSFPTYQTTRERVMLEVIQFFREGVRRRQFEKSAERFQFVQPMVQRFIGSYLGHRLAQSDVFRAADPHNHERFPKFIAEVMKGMNPIHKILTNTIGMKLKDPHGRRGRSFPSTGFAQILLWVTFDYEMYVADDCSPGEDAPGCPVPADSPVNEFYGLTLDDVISTYKLETSDCYNVDTGVDRACVREKVREAAFECVESNPDYTRSWLINSCGVPQYVEQWDCGEFGRTPEGECHDVSAETAASSAASAEVPPIIDAVLAELEVDATLGPGNPDGSGSGDDSIAVIAGAAAGGAVVLIIIIVVIVIFAGGSSRGGSSNKKAVPERTVVAFENPMYDDPGQDVAQVYDEAGPGGISAGDDEGLYDEPAFALGDKQNPMYSSQDALAPTGEGEYLEQPEDTQFADELEDEEDGGGYLDVAPEDEDE